MARASRAASYAQEFDDDLYGASPGPSVPRRSTNVTALSPSPAVSTSSDKENTSSKIHTGKGKERASNPSMDRGRASSPTGKRKRTGTTSAGDASGGRNQRRRTTEAVDDDDEQDGMAYDPAQTMEERRGLRAGLRELTRDIQDNRAEYLNAESTGIRDTLLKANQLSNQVKQTSDATIDSRLLVSTADLAKKKTLRMTSGDNAAGIDVDDFVSRIKVYMRRAHDQAEEHQSRSVQRNRRGAHTQAEDSEDDNDGEMLNWEYLGRHACLPNILRPSLPGFLLGPLSLQKRARKAVVRRAALKPSNLEETRPEVLRAGDIEKSENANLTYLCTMILKRLKEAAEKLEKEVEAEATENMTQEEQEALLDRYGMSESGNPAFFKFVINPFSFGQTIENMFYVSFLIRDGKVGIEMDKNGLPFLEHRGAESAAGSSGHTARHQAVLSLDMDEWEELIQLFDIREPMIDHREEQDNTRVGAKGWYA
ncbi:hypothetical protein CJF30_00008166 [Rutstroemia sp. NJR-2017a BBW]|nr:hypothetical protein CJF30_00008166 [Rutstroemia sp. NJR-2017a BBW]